MAVTYDKLLGQPLLHKHKDYSRAATKVVAASDATSTWGADYICDGTADDVEIQAAIDALPSTGGLVLLSEGTFTLSTFINIAKDGVTLEGMGRGTIVTIVNGGARSLVELGHATITYNYCAIRNIYFDGNGTNRTDGNIIDNGYWRTKWIVNVLVENCYLVNAYGSGVYSQSNSYCMVRNCVVLNWRGRFSGGGLYIDANTSSAIGNVLIGNQTTSFYAGIAGGRIVIGNYISMADSFAGKAVYEGPAGTPDQIIDNYIYMGASAASTAIGIYGAGECVGNRIEFGASADVASIGINQNCNLVSGNDVIKAGVGIVVSSTATNNYVDRCLADGIKTSSGASHVVLSGNKVVSPGGQTNNTYSGILITGTTTYCTVTGNMVYSIIANKPQYGIREASSGDGPNTITGNICLNAVTTNISTQHASTVVDNNITT